MEGGPSRKSKMEANPHNDLQILHSDPGVAQEVMMSPVRGTWSHTSDDNHHECVSGSISDDRSAVVYEHTRR